MIGRAHGRGRRRNSDLTVWLNPGPTGSAGAYWRELRGEVRLVVVPRTGSRHADVAVLLEPDVGEIEGVRRILPYAALYVLPATAPVAGIEDTAWRARGTLLRPGLAPAELLAEIRQLRWHWLSDETATARPPAVASTAAEDQQLVAAA